MHVLTSRAPPEALRMARPAAAAPEAAPLAPPLPVTQAAHRLHVSMLHRASPRSVSGGGGHRHGER